jgi:hypothetical protein
MLSLLAWAHRSRPSPRTNLAGRLILFQPLAMPMMLHQSEAGLVPSCKGHFEVTFGVALLPVLLACAQDQGAACSQGAHAGLDRATAHLKQTAQPNSPKIT